MTLGPALLALAAFEAVRGRLASILVMFGRVPLFYYVAHLLLVHAMAVAFALITLGDAGWMFGRPRAAASQRATDWTCPDYTWSGSWWWRCSTCRVAGSRISSVGAPIPG